jgi:hypothetical protein
LCFFSRLAFSFSSGGGGGYLMVFWKVWSARISTSLLFCFVLVKKKKRENYFPGGIGHGQSNPKNKRTRIKRKCA